LYVGFQVGFKNPKTQNCFPSKAFKLPNFCKRKSAQAVVEMSRKNALQSLVKVRTQPRRGPFSVKEETPLKNEKVAPELQRSQKKKSSSVDDDVRVVSRFDEM